MGIKAPMTFKKVILDSLHFLKMAELNLTDETEKEFDRLYDNYIFDGTGDWIAYENKSQKYLFLNYIIENKDVLVHGTSHPDIVCFEPRGQTLFNGKPVKAVFAASDGIWSLFFAVINRKDYSGSLRNACLTVPTKKGIKRYYYFSVNRDFHDKCWTNGTIYILPKQSFIQGGIKDEWICEKKVKPLAKLAVTPEDFPFIEKVKRHTETESMLKTLVKALLLNR